MTVVYVKMNRGRLQTSSEAKDQFDFAMEIAGLPEMNDERLLSSTVSNSPRLPGNRMTRSFSFLTGSGASQHSGAAMNRQITLFLGVLLFGFSGVVLADGGEKLTFNRNIRPILSKNCFACHGLDKKKRKADLRLDVAKGAFADLDGRHAIQPGNPEASEAWKRITTNDPDDIMPPPDSDKKLDAAERATIRQWIEQGAPYEQHWAFIAPVKPPVPKVMGAKNPVDAFLLDRLTREGLAFSPEARKETLIRRVTLDLTGLPPTPRDVEAFVADHSPDAWDKLVSELQSRPAYGENMARYWLDLARYADTHGLHLDNERSMWPYRDWVVRAFNQNLPFDDFTRWQLAGDLMPHPTRDERIASGFNRCNPTTSEGGSINEEFIYRYALDRTTTTVEVWMALTAGCAVCHDHKFDPLSTREYYSLYAFFNSAADPAMDGNKIDTPPILKLTTREDQARLKELDKNIAAVDEKIKKALAAVEYQDPAVQTPAPPAREVEDVWFEDGFPAGTKPRSSGAPLQLVNKADGARVFSGNVALRRQAGQGVEQDYFSGGASFPVPRRGKIFVSCYLDPKDPPQAIMVQFHVGGWKYRAIWGEEEKIPFGKPGTTQKVLMGTLPETGKWIRLEFPASKVGLKAGQKVGGYAFTQYGGIVNWDRLGVSSRVEPSKDPAWSYKIWVEKNQGKRNDLLPEGLRQLLRGKKADQWTKEEGGKIRSFWLTHVYAGNRDLLAPMEQEKAPLEKEKSDIEKKTPLTFVMADLPKPRESFVMIRGAYDKPGEKVTRAVPAVFPPLPGRPKDRDYNRLDLANWLVNGKHPLTARVMVNRIWQQMFGMGIVKSSNDFGTQGEPPSHPELLDWLAIHFMESGWDMKELVHLLVTSRAYRQTSRITPELLKRDPENRLLARASRYRLDAEELRDQALFVSGLLVPTVGGRGVNPYQPPNIWEPVAFGGSNTRFYKQGVGDDLYRRSLYTFIKRTAPPPFMSSFDAPNREQSCARRGRSDTPLQALQLMNDVQQVEAARNLAQRMLKNGGKTLDERITWAWKSVTARAPDPDELSIARNAFSQHLNRYESDEKAAVELVSYGESKRDENIKASELAAYTMVANLIMNLDEVIVRN